MKIFIFILLFFVVVGLVIVNNNQLHLSNTNELKTFSELYEQWLGETYSNFWSITGHITKLNWLPE